MILELRSRNRLLFIQQADKIEYDQLNLATTISGFDYKGNKKIAWTKKYLENGSYISSGFWHKLASLRKIGYNVQMPNLTNIIDTSVTIENINEWIDDIDFANPKINPRWYQRKALFLSQKYSVSRGDFATGAGKTLICYLVSRYILEKKLSDKGKKVLIVVPSIQLVSQTRDEWMNELQTDNYITLDIISGSFPELRNATGNVILGNIDSLKEFPASFFKDVGAIIYDEAHKLTTATYQQIFFNCLSNDLEMIYSVSGSWYDANTKGDFESESISGPLLISVPAHQLMKEGSLTPVQIHEVPLVYDKQISEMYYNHNDCQVTEFVNKRNHFELNFIRSQRKRFDAIVNIAGKVEHNQLMLFKSVAYCKAFAAELQKLFVEKQIHVIVGDVGSSDRERIKQLTANNDNVVICATYGTMSTGISINNLWVLHLVEPPKSFIWVRQSIGRMLRLHPSKDTAIIISYVDIFKKYIKTWLGPARTNIAANHLTSRVKIYIQQKFEYKILPEIKL